MISAISGDTNKRKLSSKRKALKQKVICLHTLCHIILRLCNVDFAFSSTTNPKVINLKPPTIFNLHHLLHEESKKLLSMEGNTSSSESTTVQSTTPWIIDTVLLILLIILIFLLFMCYLMPSFLYNASDFLQPSSIKKCVDYFDVLLIIIAISSHLLSRYGSRSSSDNDTTSDRDNEIVTSQADTYSSEEKFYDAQQKFGEGGLKRISNSYPDLRNESLWGIEDYGFKFFDDFDVDMYRPVQVADNCNCTRRRSRRKKKVADSNVKEIQVVHPPTPPKSPPPEDSVPVQTSQIQDHKEIQTLPTEIWNFSEEGMSTTKSGMKKSSSAKDLANLIASSFINQRERKRKQKMRNLQSNQNESSLSASKVPPPPPPPPPPSIFYNLFKRGRKIKKMVNSAPPPPPPLPQRSVFNNLFKNGNVSKQFQSITGSALPLPPSSVIKSKQLQLVSASAQYSIFNNTLQSGTEFKRFNSVSSPPSPKPPLISQKTMNYNDEDQSPAVHIQLLLPPPPPLSELELAEEIDRPSFGSPPDVEEDVNSVSSESTTAGRDVSGWMICPTPDVNMKADTFIARLRGEWKTEIMNSLREGGESSGI
ncbi:uncharacterized protein LOC124911455 [Impatiens glandulifera]|uniref:uncharacterized protein LOC124911455 n=1 Tax=Impatiens glandulifera TaxID=253017 RepID=UPI001FB15628|nr:uncharacterized protein LOC124911455 [Impatiens glandulifera]